MYALKYNYSIHMSERDMNEGESKQMEGGGGGDIGGGITQNEPTL
jgi:hypothetical protein